MERKRKGRPPFETSEGSTRDWPLMTTRISPEAKMMLDALVWALKQPQHSILKAGLTAYLDTLPPRMLQIVQGLIDMRKETSCSEKS